MNKFRLGKLILYLIVLIGLIYYLVEKDILKWIIAVLSVLYLVFYFSIGSISVFIATLSEMGSLVGSLSRTSPILVALLLGPMILILWLVMLFFWPLFIIPNEHFVRNKQKYDAIYNFENKIKSKYNI